MRLEGLTESQRKRIQLATENIPFASLLGIKVESVGAGVASMVLKVRPDLLQNNGVVHGGAIASLIDSVTAFAVIPLLADDETASTVDLTVTFIRPLQSGTVTASARVLRAGSRIIALSAEVMDELGNLTATGLTTYLRQSKRRNKS